MPIASHIETPNKPIPAGQPWTIKRLFPFSGAVKAMVKVYNPSEIIGAFMIFITGFGELLGREFSWFWYFILLINLGGAFCTRYFDKQYERGSLNRGIPKPHEELR
jgi:hypothetical protein